MAAKQNACGLKELRSGVYLHQIDSRCNIEKESQSKQREITANRRFSDKVKVLIVDQPSSRRARIISRCELLDFGRHFPSWPGIAKDRSLVMIGNTNYDKLSQAVGIVATILIQELEKK